MKKLRTLLCLTAFVATGSFFLTGRIVSATNAPQTLPFSQNWSNTALITVNDDWAGVPGIIGYRGDDLTVATGTDPRTLLADGSATPVDVNANQTNPDTFTTGGVAEFEITNPTIALNGSGTADAPHIVVHLNTTDQSNINFQCNLRDLDASADDATMQVDVQFRVGGTGSYASVPGGYFADVTTGGTATQVTPVNVNLPASADNAPLVEIRVITTNAVGNDEWVGVDDISVTAQPQVPGDAPVDFNGDGKTDFAVARNQSGQLTWYWSLNGGGGTGQADWGLIGDIVLMEDFDGDGKDDITVWRPALGTASAFYIFESETGTVRVTPFGVIGDDATVIGDYDGDGKADEAVYRPGAMSGDPSTWFFRGSLNNPSGNITYFPWGVNGDRVAPGDYDGDGKNDFVIRRDTAAQGVWWQRRSTGATIVQTFGLSSDRIVPGDYDADGKTDLTALRSEAGPMIWFYLPSTGGPYQEISWGNSSDFAVQGDYDGDGKTDVAVWKATNPAQFLVRSSNTGGYISMLWGGSNDLVIAFYNRH
jgi:hypothetical protein